MRLALLLCASCALRATPYRFSGPVVSTVTLAPEFLTHVPGFSDPPTPTPTPTLAPTPAPAPARLPLLPGSSSDLDSVSFALSLTDHPDFTRAQTLPPSTALRPGDLLGFPDFAAAVTAVDARGVAEIWYVAHGIVHRGFVDPSRPRTKRDADGRVVNTFIAHDHDLPPPGTKDLAGEMLVNVSRW